MPPSADPLGSSATTAATRTVRPLTQHLALVALVVRDCDEAIAFYTKILGFDLIDDTFIPDEGKRWVVIAPPGDSGAKLLLARAMGDHQESRVGDQTGGRVGFFLYTDDFWRDYRKYQENGVVFVREPKIANYGTVAVFRDLYGNLWDLLEISSLGGLLPNNPPKLTTAAFRRPSGRARYAV